MLKKAEEFLRANKGSPVVEGYVIEGGGARYRLQNGSTYILTLDECREVGALRWKESKDD